jgi:hypothetical protein
MKNKYSIILYNHGERNIALQDYFASFPFQNLREHHGDLQNPLHQNWSISRILLKKSLSVCFWQTMDLYMLYMLCFNMCFCTICIALSLPWFSLSPKWFQAYTFFLPPSVWVWSALLMMFFLCTISFTDVMRCNVHPSVLLCVEADRCGDCLRMHTQLHCTQSLTVSSLISPISEFYIFSVTNVRCFQHSNCSLILKVV